ncbi:phage major capsid protein [Litorivita pollutaquae]|uniref:Phage major capsid protein n=1 Tax=Litorivita pollutaquae TaxID=2200892 RepID=A0A2V4N2R8_9RHOB|nr:phage major capsid protein [Litorivita pollutaquae]PYC48192.1 phage major capsid protein [Litorivita pollutaquae]
MLESVKLQKRQSTIRQTLAALAAKESPDENEIRSMGELDAEYTTNEVRYRAALIAEDDERRDAKNDLETRSDQEWSDMVAKFELRQVALNLDEGRALDGETAEIVQEMRSTGGYRGVPVPFEALEQRAGETVSTGTPDPMNTRPIIERLFPASVAARLGVQSINVTQGSEAWPVATSGAVAGWAATEGGSIGDASAFATAEATLSPDQTLGAHMRITRKAMKQSGAGLEAAIRRDMAAAIGAELDRAVLNGSGASGQPLGIVTGAATYGITSTDMSAAAVSWAAFRAEVVAFMEANAISAASAIRLGLTPALWSDLDDTLVSGTAVSEWDRMVKHIPQSNIATTNTLGAGTAILTANVGGMAPAFVGLWGGVDVIRDVYSDAQSGGLRLTGLVTADVTVARGLQTRILTNFG